MGVCRKMNEIFKGKVVAITWKDSGGGAKALASAWLSLLGSEERTWAPLLWSFYPSSGYAVSEHQHWGLSRSTTILLIREESDAGKDRRHEEMGAAEGEGLESSTDLVDMNLSKLRESGGQKSPVCYSPWGCKELTRTETEQQQSFSLRHSPEGRGSQRSNRPLFLRIWSQRQTRWQ